MQRRRFRWDVLGVALLGSLLTHVLLAPRLLLPLIERPEVPLEVSYVPDVEGPPSEEPSKPDEPSKLDEPPKPDEEQPPPDEKPQQKAERERKKKERLDEARRLLSPPDVAQVEPKTKPPEPEPPHPVVAPPPPPKERLKMVDQDRPDDEPDNAEAKYLAQTNHRAKEDTRTLDTNLVREVRGAESHDSEPSQNQLPKPGMKEQKVAELVERKGKKQIVRGNPKLGDEGEAKQSTPKPGKLSMRGLTPRSIEQAPSVKQREGVELRDPDRGSLPEQRVGQGEQRASSASRGNRTRPNLSLSPLAYDDIVGESVAARERHEAVLAEKSHAVGRWDRVQQKMAALRSSLENFTSEVKVGNQAELGTRAHPFAAYIAEMHRSIHKLFAFDFLPSLDSKGIGDPFNNMEMWVQLEIVLQADGTVERVGIVRPSGYLPFDAAAMDAVRSSSPFPRPPNSIRSGNGKVYLDWRFHRDDRQCGTFGVDPHILLNGEEKDRPHDTSEVMVAAGGAGGGGAHASGPGTGTVPKTGASAAASPSLAGLPRSVRNSAPAAPQKETEDVQSGPELTEVPVEARDAAEGWFSAYARGDVGWLGGWSAAPFQTSGEVAAKDGAAVKALFAEMLKEKSAGRHVDKGVDVMTPAAARQKFGSAPRGGDNDTLYAVGKVGTDEFVLLLKKSNRGWRVCGLNRL